MTIHKTCESCSTPVALDIIYSSREAPELVLCEKCLEQEVVDRFGGWVVAFVIGLFLCVMGWSFSEPLHAWFPWAFRWFERLFSWN